MVSVLSCVRGLLPVRRWVQARARVPAGVLMATMNAEEQRERNRLYQQRFNAKRRGEDVPPRYSSHDDEATATPAREERLRAAKKLKTPAERQEHQHYMAAVRQHLSDVATGMIPPAAGTGQRIR